MRAKRDANKFSQRFPPQIHQWIKESNIMMISFSITYILFNLFSFRLTLTYNQSGIFIFILIKLKTVINKHSKFIVTPADTRITHKYKQHQIKDEIMYMFSYFKGYLSNKFYFAIINAIFTPLPKPHFDFISRTLLFICHFAV